LVVGGLAWHWLMDPHGPGQPTWPWPAGEPPGVGCVDAVEVACR